MDRVIPDIVGGEQPVRSQLLLKAEIPLFEIRRLDVERNGRICATRGKDKVLADGHREWISARVALPRVLETAHRIVDRNRFAPGRLVGVLVEEERARQIAKYFP